MKYKNPAKTSRIARLLQPIKSTNVPSKAAILVLKGSGRDFNKMAEKQRRMMLSLVQCADVLKRSLFCEIAINKSKSLHLGKTQVHSAIKNMAPVWRGERKPESERRG